MKTLPALALAVSTFFASHSYAQFGGLLKDLKTLTDKVQQAQPSTQNQSPTNTVPNPSPAANNLAGSSPRALINSYCDRVNSSPFITKIADFSIKFNEVGSNTDIKSYFARHEPAIANWISEKLKTSFGLDPNPAYPITDNRIKTLSDTINNCAKNSSNQPFATYLKEINASQDTPFVMQPMGNYIKLDVRPNIYWLMLLPDGSEDFISSLNPNLMDQINDRLNERVAYFNQQKQIDAEKQAEINQRNQKSQREAKELEEKNKKEQAFASTPDGQLTIAYQNFQIVQLCYDLRKDFAVKFIGPSDYQDYRSKIKKIEQTLEKKTKEKDTNKLYALAEQRNRSFNIAAGLANIERDIIEMITNNSKGSNWMTAKDDCNLFATRLRNNADEILGKETIKKNF